MVQGSPDGQPTRAARGRCPHCGRRLPPAPCRCSRRDCPGYVDLWLGDQRVRVLENVLSYDGPVAVLTITGPGVEYLPWSEHEPGLADPERTRAWNITGGERYSALHARAYQRVYREHGPGKLRRLAVVPELQKRGVLHWHVILGYSFKHRAAAQDYARHVRDLAPEVVYGFVDRLPARPMFEHAGKAAAYAAKYLTKEGDGHGLRELVLTGQAPRRAVHVDRRLTDRTRCTMRTLRRRRHFWMRHRQTASCIELDRWYRKARHGQLRKQTALLDALVNDAAPAP